MLDAVFSSYFDQAQNQGIRVEATISLPDVLSIDEGEMAVVLANALENAIHANLALPWDQREIRCKIVWKSVCQAGGRKARTVPVGESRRYCLKKNEADQVVLCVTRGTILCRAERKHC